MALGFYRVADFEGPAQARSLADAWSGMIILPLVPPSSPGGKWLSSPAGRKELEFITGPHILLVYPNQENEIEFVPMLEGLCEAFSEHELDIRRVFPSPALLVVSSGLERCFVIRLKNRSLADKVREEDVIRRGVQAVIRAILTGGVQNLLMMAEAKAFDLVYSLEDAAPVLCSFAERIAKQTVSKLFKTPLPPA